jgi:hypothetical protein
MPMIGFLRQFVARWCRTLVAAFRQGLNITGFVEVRTLVEYRSIAAPAAKAATRSILIVLAGGAQPVGAQPVRTRESPLR